MKSRLTSQPKFYEDRYKSTQGDVDVIFATDNQVVKHEGNAMKAEAVLAGAIVVSGAVANYVRASVNGKIHAHGDTKDVKAYCSGRVSLAGNPQAVDAAVNGRAVIFGEPKSIRSTGGANVTVVSLDEAYEPDNLLLADWGSVGVITPRDLADKAKSSYLGYDLNILFPEGQANPLYVAYTDLTQRGKIRYIRSE